MADITITHAPGEHTTLTGSQKGDGVLEIVRLHGRFTWRRYSGIHIAASRDKAPQMHRINTAKKALEDAGHTVTLEIDDTIRPTAEREADRAERSAARVERLGERADRAAAQSDARQAASNAISDHIPFGQPKLVDHHSYGRACRDEKRMHGHQQASWDLSKKADQLTERAQGAAHLQEMRTNPRVTMRRVEKLKTDRRLYERRIAERGGADKAPNAAAEVARLTEEIGYWEGLLAELAESGAFVAWGPDHFRKGDKVNVGGQWCTVRRVNKKSVSVPWIVGTMAQGVESEHSDTVPWDKVTGRRRDGMQLDTPNGEAWPVELARKVTRWARLAHSAGLKSAGHDDESRREVRHVGYARRLVHGLPITAAEAEVQAFAPPADDVETVRLLAAASVDIFDRLQAGELAPDIAATVTPFRPVEPAWTMPDGDPDRIPVKELEAGDIVAGEYGTGGLFGGSEDRLSRYFCGPVAQVIPHKGSEYSGERFVGYWTVVLEDGTQREFKPWRLLGVFRAPAPVGSCEQDPDELERLANKLIGRPIIAHVARAGEVAFTVEAVTGGVLSGTRPSGEPFSVHIRDTTSTRFEWEPAPGNAFDAAAVRIERDRSSVTQGEVSVSYRGELLGRFGDAVELCKTGSNGGDPHPHDDGASCFGGYHGHGNAHWIDAARWEIAHRAALVAAKAAGRQAYAEGRMRAPGADAEVLNMVEGYPVGRGAAEIFKAFTDGFDAVADEAAARVLEEDAPAGTFATWAAAVAASPAGE